MGEHAVSFRHSLSSSLSFSLFCQGPGMSWAPRGPACSLFSPSLFIFPRSYYLARLCLLGPAFRAYSPRRTSARTPVPAAQRSRHRASTHACSRRSSAPSSMPSSMPCSKKPRDKAGVAGLPQITGPFSYTFPLFFVAEYILRAPGSSK